MLYKNIIRYIIFFNVFISSYKIFLWGLSDFNKAILGKKLSNFINHQYYDTNKIIKYEKNPNVIERKKYYRIENLIDFGNNYIINIDNTLVENNKFINLMKNLQNDTYLIYIENINDVAINKNDERKKHIYEKLSNYKYYDTKSYLYFVSWFIQKK